MRFWALMALLLGSLGALANHCFPGSCVDLSLGTASFTEDDCHWYEEGNDCERGELDKAQLDAIVSCCVCGGGECFDCICQNGLPISNSSCPYVGAQACASCDVGYFLHDYVCLENMCTCEHGFPLVGSACREHGEPACSSCDPGYSLFGNECIEESWVTPTSNIYTKEESVGGWGGLCTCPDGQKYNVGDNRDSCGSLACEGGVPGECHQVQEPERIGMKVTCAQAAPAPGPGALESMPVGAAADAPAPAEDAIVDSALHAKVASGISPFPVAFVASFLAVGLFVGARACKSHQYSASEARMLVPEDQAKDEDAA